MVDIRYPVSLPYFPPEEIEKILPQIRAILEGREVLSMGPQVRTFEQAFAKYIGVPFAVGTNACSAALEIALRTINIRPGDEVVVPVETFIATGATVVREGGKVVFAEIDPNTFCLSAESLKKCLTPKTRAVILVHIAGLVTPDIFEIQKICRERGLVLIEDVAHAPGASFNGKKAGSFGDFGCFSFYPTKVITTGEGGMLVTSNKQYYELANSFRNRGRDMQSAQEQYSRLGTNNRMTEIVAILGKSQLACLDAFIDRRNEIARFYSEALKSCSKEGLLSPLAVPPDIRHAYWRYIVQTAEKVDRVRLQEAMKKKGIQIDWAYEPPLHLQPFFRTLYATREGMFPVSEKALRHFVCLPIHPQLQNPDVATIAKALAEAVENCIV